MKRFICIVLAVSCIAMASAASKFNFTWAAGSSAMLYGDPSFVEKFDALKERGCKNIVLSGELGLRFMFIENIGFCLNAIINMDTLTNLSDFGFFLDYGLSGGIKVNLGLGGLSLGMEYVTGRRSDSITDLPENITPWGNGFRFLAEYEFTNFIKSFSPALGIAWRRMPRGNNSADNMLSFYIRSAF